MEIDQMHVNQTIKIDKIHLHFTIPFDQKKQKLNKLMSMC